jgi:hypothetical protein
MTTDTERLHWLFTDLGISSSIIKDGVEYDYHEEAAKIAAARGHEEETKEDLIESIRNGIDLLMEADKND